jgi:hypothetical protein
VLDDPVLGFMRILTAAVVESQSKNGSSKTAEKRHDFQISTKYNTKRYMNNLYFVQELNLRFLHKIFCIDVDAGEEFGLDACLISL